MPHAISQKTPSDIAVARMIPALCSAIAIAILTAAVALVLGLSVIWVVAIYSGTGATALATVGWQIGRSCAGCAG